MKKSIVSTLLFCSLMATSVTSYAWISRRISNSGHNTIKTSYDGIYARGYTTSSSYHYTTAKLFCSNGQIRTSDRNWGTGTVSASTNSLKYNSYNSYGSAVYYGFS